MSSNVIEVDKVSKTYRSDRGEVTALKDVSFTVHEGQFVTVVGPSGCGKSTLMAILAGLQPASGGEIRLDGAAVRGPQPEKIGVVFQESTLLPWKTALGNVEFPLELRHEPKAKRRERAAALLDLVGLTEAADRFPHELSGGMRQRVSIARGLVRDPRVLLMDEPFSALDEQSRTRMGQELLRIWERSRKTVVFITHGINEAIYLADMVLVMGANPGRIVEALEVNLPRPRNYDMIGSERFGALRNRIWHHIAGDAE